MTSSDNNRPGEVEPLAWLHTMHMELDQTSVRLGFSDQNPWGAPGVDYSAEYVVTVQPLYASTALQRNVAVGRRAGMEEAARIAESQNADDWFEVGRVVVATGKRIANHIRTALTQQESRNAE